MSRAVCKEGKERQNLEREGKIEIERWREKKGRGRKEKVEGLRRKSLKKI